MSINQKTRNYFAPHGELVEKVRHEIASRSRRAGRLARRSLVLFLLLDGLGVFDASGFQLASASGVPNGGHQV